MTTTLPTDAVAGLRRRISMSRTGRWLLVAQEPQIELVDLFGTMPTRTVPRIAGTIDFVGRELWGIDGDELTRLTLTDLSALPGPRALPVRAAELRPGFGAGATEVLLAGEPPCRISYREGAIVIDLLDDLLDGEAPIGLYGGRTFVTGPDTLRAIDRTRGEAWRTARLDGDVLAMSVLFGGRALAVLARRAEDDVILVLHANGGRIHQVAVPRVQRWAVAEELGHAFLLGADQKLARVDLRYGRVIAEGRPPLSISELAVDQDGRHAVLSSIDDGEVLQLLTSELMGSLPSLVAVAEDEPVREEPTRPAPTPAAVTIDVASAPPLPIDARAGELPPVPSRARPPSAVVPDDLPLAFGPPPPPAPPQGAGVSPYPGARAHLDALLDIVAARTAVAIADAWNSGRLSPTNATRRPHELEVEALLGGSGSFAAEKLAETKARLLQRQEEASNRARASTSAGIRLPFPSLVRELGMSGVAAQILLVVAAPALSGEIARLYGVLSNDPARPMVDRFLIEQIIAGDRSVLRDQIARELSADAPMVRHGVVQVEPGSMSLFARLSVSDALLDRLRGLPPVRVDDATIVRGDDVGLDALFISPAIKRDLVTALAAPSPAHAPLRLVVRGRRGCGRHSVVAALAARVEREIVTVDTTRLPHGRRELIAALRSALFRASMHGLIPVLSGLEQIEPTDTEIRDAVRQVLRQHPGPVVIRTTPEGNLPLAPGFVSVTLPPLIETERATVWSAMLQSADLHADSDRLAARYRIGPGVIRRVIDEVAKRAVRGHGDATAALDEQVRQHVAARLDHVAKHVDRTAQWEEVALPEEILDSLREFIGRARHRRTVYEHWNYDAKMTSSRGLTALFYGPPGTGKTMVAGVVAQELGLDMYRVDLARVVSKWVGETEKNLAEVFDAAEDGQVLILFDEADSLFAKRTDVRTSNDRYANLEVNYLLQRLDTFEGVAILTSNLDGSIDPAFKRRLSLRLQFPFPDEETRIRLWSGMVTPQTPTDGTFDFPELARRFPLSGGYIRNCVLRAAFLAAHEGRPMTQDHLLRAVQLEYREMGKLSTTSRLE